ncbi:MAG: PadR family transcriptional regulator [Bdellovibrio sp.]|nr:PadR family transcriptional regulator [Bdellovibrio sp.]
MRRSCWGPDRGGFFEMFEGRGRRRGGGFGMGRGGHGGRGFGGMEEKLGRILGHGDLRYVILLLLEEKPRHGYELIKALEEMSSGAYVPSPGVIYPTLTFLEEGGFAVATEDAGKKLYTITPEGKVMLDENREFVQAVLQRMQHMGQKMSRLREWMGREGFETRGKDEKDAIHKSMHSLKSELFSAMDASKETKKQIAEIIARAAEEIRKLKE